MKFLYAVAIVTVASAASAAEIPAGTHLLLRVEHSVSTSTAKAGDGVHLRTVTPVSAGGRIVIPVGSYAQGVITHAKRSARIRGQAQLQIQLVTLMLPSGEVLKISPKTTSIEPDNSSPPARQALVPELSGPSLIGGGVLGPTLAGLAVGGKTGGRVALAAMVAAAVIPAIAARGKEVELHQGMAVDVVFDGAAVIE